MWQTAQHRLDGNIHDLDASQDTQPLNSRNEGKKGR